MLALADAVDEGRIPGAEIALVVSDHANAAGLASANERGLKTMAIEREGRSREEHDRAIVAALKDHGVDIVCLAGYMRLLSSYFIESLPQPHFEYSSESAAGVSRTRRPPPGP